MFAKIGDVKHGLGIRELQPLEVGVQAGVWGAEVGDASCCADASAGLEMIIFSSATGSTFVATGSRVLVVLTMTTIRRTFFSFMYLATPSTEQLSSVRDGALSEDPMAELSFPMESRSE